MGHLVAFPTEQTTFYVADLDGFDVGAGVVLDAEGPLHLTAQRVDWATLTLVPDLEALRQPLIERIKAIRDEREFGTVATPQGVLQIDERSQGRMARALELGRTYEKLTGQTFATAWRMYDNSEAPIGVAHLEGWSLVIGAQVQHVFARYADLYSAIMAATSTEQLAGIDVEGGWDVGAA